MAKEAAEATQDAETSIDIHEILDRLPHRYPFLLVDRAEQYRSHQSIVGIKNVTFNEPFFPGHFPENPVMPGVLIIEAMAQTGALLMSKSLDVDIDKINIFFMGVESARFRNPVRPGDVLRLEVEVLRGRRDVFKFRGRAVVSGKLCAESDFTAISVPKT